MKKVFYSLIALVVLAVCGCQKDPNPYITKQQALALQASIEPTIANVAFIYNSNIYYVSDFTKPAVQVTSDGSADKYVRMSHDHSKFAYLNSSNIIKVVDAKGAVLTTLSQYTDVRSFDWSADDKTLYILNNSEMVYYGPAMNLPDFTGPGNVVGSIVEVLSASVSMQGDFAYVVHTFTFDNGDQYSLVIDPVNKGPQVSYTDPDGSTMNYVSFSTNLQDLAVGYGNPNVISGPETQIDLFTGLFNTPVGSYTAGCSPVYNSTLNFVVGGFADAANKGLTAPAAIYMGAPPTNGYIDQNVEHSLFLDKYSGSGTILYTDWK